MIQFEKRPLIDLEKDANRAIGAVGLAGQAFEVAAVFDVSGSMDTLYRQGEVQSAADRVIALAKRFDDDGNVPVWAFDNRVSECGVMGPQNYVNFVQDKVAPLVRGSTAYAPVMQAVTARYKPSSGVFGLGKRKVTTPVYVLFFTDGDNNYDDKDVARRAVAAASQYPIFWQFVGLGRGPFPFLEGLDTMGGRHVDNANFFAFDGRVSDRELYERLLKELPQWLKTPQVQAMLAPA